MSRPRVLFWVTHLLGIGHLRRAATLARALAADGFEVWLASGGMPVPDTDAGGARFVQLPPARAVDLYFKRLVDEEERPIDDAWRARRRDRTLGLYREVRPDILITELFPFGRRQFAFELEPLIAEARAGSGAGPRTRIVSSVRDILVEPGKPEHRDQMLHRAETLYDMVLVHGDPRLVPFEETFPQAARLAGRVRYTGYVVEPGAAAPPPSGEVVVSAGGGAVGEPLLRAALSARPLSPLADAPWRCLVGHNLPEPFFRELRARAPAGVVVERARPDFMSLLRAARLSISQGGYNTVMEVLDAGCRAVVVPYAGGLESEQTLRARRLAERGLLQTVPAEDLSPAALAAAMERALAVPPPAAVDIDRGGRARTVGLLRGLLAEAAA